MKLQEIFEQLTYGELSQLSIGGNDQGVIDENNWGQVVSHIDLGLTALYRRFFLKEGRLVLGLLPDRTLYKLHSDYATSNAVVPVEDRYIVDSVDAPFIDDILKVERVLTDEGLDVGLNDGADEYSVTTPTTFTLRVPVAIVNQDADLPDWLKTENLELVYRANHPKLVVSALFDPATVEVELPPAYLEALLYYVASRANNPVGMVNEFNAGNNWYMKYEAACQELEAENLQVDKGGSNTRLERNGWV